MNARISRARIAVLAVVLGLLMDIAIQNPAAAISNGSAVMQGMGFDRCDLPNSSQMHAFFYGTPLYWYGGYLGGSSFGCANTSGPVTASWLNTENAAGWNFEYI
ncbi:MAG: hypothetical protein WAW53_10800, partial [Candidatus Dormiibacterota bacterium]